MIVHLGVLSSVITRSPRFSQRGRRRDSRVKSVSADAQRRARRVSEPLSSPFRLPEYGPGGSLIGHATAKRLNIGGTVRLGTDQYPSREDPGHAEAQFCLDWI